MTLQEIKEIAESPDSTLEQVLEALAEMARLNAALDAITEMSPTRH